ncbi:MAG: bifunctional DNA-formamidopyrimidine glycosylase/DNA-(apurinic or apyrimidinic site) lyase [Candidatus Liptonbacteria bacterium]|nr:bifunctional DNA-formamidopyrimidine glycosylase/DNA-(apurinic or apyrimidinic site) lyase [Candidatus Liptonbacteria bacterium]
MPELPEVEALRRGLAKYLVGQKIKRVAISEPKLVSGRGNLRRASRAKTAAFIKILTGQRIAGIERRAKNLIFRFRSGAVLLVHLKMTGQLVCQKRGARSEERGENINRGPLSSLIPLRSSLVMGGHPIEISEHILPNKHTCVIFELTKGVLFYNDTRKFGYLLAYPDIATFEHANHFADLGLEPFDRKFTAEYLRRALRGKSSKLKTVLMNQSVVTGLGNIYCDEVCFAAGIRPTRRANTLTPTETKRLYQAIQKILSRAIKLGGSSVATYRLADGSRGNYAREHKVYGRGKQKCYKCSSVLCATKVANRTTVYCRNCQQ